MNFELYLILASIPKMLTGLGVTLQLLFLASLLGLALGIILLMMRISGREYFAFPGFIYIYFFRGTPILVQIFVIYHGLPQFEFIRASVLWPILREPVRSRTCADLSMALMSTSNPDYYDRTNAPALEWLKKATRCAVYGGSCMFYARIASGRVDICIEVQFQIYDYLALIFLKKLFIFDVPFIPVKMKQKT